MEIPNVEFRPIHPDNPNVPSNTPDRWSKNWLSQVCRQIVKQGFAMVTPPIEVASLIQAATSNFGNIGREGSGNEEIVFNPRPVDSLSPPTSSQNRSSEVAKGSDGEDGTGTHVGCINEGSAGGGTPVQVYAGSSSEMSTVNNVNGVCQEGAGADGTQDKLLHVQFQVLHDAVSLLRSISSSQSHEMKVKVLVETRTKTVEVSLGVLIDSWLSKINESTSSSDAETPSFCWHVAADELRNLIATLKRNADNFPRNHSLDKVNDTDTSKKFITNGMDASRKLDLLSRLILSELGPEYTSLLRDHGGVEGYAGVDADCLSLLTLHRLSRVDGKKDTGNDGARCERNVEALASMSNVDAKSCAPESASVKDLFDLVDIESHCSGLLAVFITLPVPDVYSPTSTHQKFRPPYLHVQDRTVSSSGVTDQAGRGGFRPVPPGTMVIVQGRMLEAVSTPPPGLLARSCGPARRLPPRPRVRFSWSSESHVLGDIASALGGGGLLAYEVHAHPGAVATPEEYGRMCMGKSTPPLFRHPLRVRDLLATSAGRPSLARLARPDLFSGLLATLLPGPVPQDNSRTPCAAAAHAGWVEAGEEDGSSSRPCGVDAASEPADPEPVDQDPLPEVCAGWSSVEGSKGCEVWSGLVSSDGVRDDGGGAAADTLVSDEGDSEAGRLADSDGSGQRAASLATPPFCGLVQKAEGVSDVFTSDSPILCKEGSETRICRGSARGGNCLGSMDIAWQVMMYLDIVRLCRASAVCRAWKSAAQLPSLWRRVDLSGVADLVTDEVLAVLAGRMRATRQLVLSGCGRVTDFGVEWIMAVDPGRRGGGREERDRWAKECEAHGLPAWMYNSEVQVKSHRFRVYGFGRETEAGRVFVRGRTDEGGEIKVRLDHVRAALAHCKAAPTGAAAARFDVVALDHCKLMTIRSVRLLEAAATELRGVPGPVTMCVEAENGLAARPIIFFKIRRNQPLKRLLSSYTATAQLARWAQGVQFRLQGAPVYAHDTALSLGLDDQDETGHDMPRFLAVLPLLRLSIFLVSPGPHAPPPPSPAQATGSLYINLVNPPELATAKPHGGAESPAVSGGGAVASEDREEYGIAEAGAKQDKACEVAALAGWLGGGLGVDQHDFALRGDERLEALDGQCRQRLGLGLQHLRLSGFPAPAALAGASGSGVNIGMPGSEGGTAAAVATWRGNLQPTLAQIGIRDGQRLWSWPAFAAPAPAECRRWRQVQAARAWFVPPSWNAGCDAWVLAAEPPEPPAPEAGASVVAVVFGVFPGVSPAPACEATVRLATMVAWGAGEEEPLGRQARFVLVDVRHLLALGPPPLRVTPTLHVYRQTGRGDEVVRRLVAVVEGCSDPALRRALARARAL